MKTIWVSDTHNREISIPDGDVLFHCGDFTMNGTEKEIRMFNDWMGELPHKNKIVIAGNHDWLFQTDPEKARSLCNNFTYLQDSEVIVNGFKIYGSPWQPEFFDWAFNVKRGELHKKWDLIPDDVDILLTHGPAFGHLDQIPNGMRVGCEELEKRIQELSNIKIHGAGHIHHSYGMKETPKLDTFVRDNEKIVRLNPSICDERYRPNNKPIILEI